MASSVNLARIKRGVVLLIVLLFVGGAGELLRRHWDREQEKAIRRALVHARTTGQSPAEVEPDWDRLADSLRSRIRSDPGGSLARLAHHAAARVALDLPRSFSLADQSRFPVVYGDRPADEIPVPEGSYLWIAEIEGAWHGGPWRLLDRGMWGPNGPSHGEIDIAAFVPEDHPGPGWITLRLRLLLKFYDGDDAIAAARASSPEELAQLAIRHQERRPFVGYRVEIPVREDGPASP